MITINLDKAKTIAHEARRAARAEEFAPLDQKIASQIPGTDPAAVEAERQAVRAKYASMQTAIDSATSAEAIKSAAAGVL